MTNQPNQNPEVKYPALCHYRIIAIDHPNMKFVIETVSMNLGITAPVVPGRKSAGFKYRSFGIEVVVHSKEQMERFDQEFRNIEGVKMVL